MMATQSDERACAVPSLVSRLLPQLIALTGAKRLFSDPEKTARSIEDSRLRPSAFGPPKRLERRVRITVDHDGGWPVYRVAPLGQPSEQYVVYAHGGAWIREIHPLQWRLVATLARQSGATIIVPIYPLAPRGTAGVVVPTMADMLADLIGQHGAGRVSALGDSAGGQIMLSAALLLRERGVPAPRHTILISPALDLTMANPEVDRVEPLDPWLARAGIRTAIEHWRGTLALDHMLVSPLFSDLRGLGGLTIFSGMRDITNPDTRLLVAKARAAGVAVDYHEAPGLIHVYPLLPCPEGRAARQVMIDLLR